MQLVFYLAVLNVIIFNYSHSINLSKLGNYYWYNVEPSMRFQRNMLFVFEIGFSHVAQGGQELPSLPQSPKHWCYRCELHI